MFNLTKIIMLHSLPAHFLTVNFTSATKFHPHSRFLASFLVNGAFGRRRSESDSHLHRLLRHRWEVVLLASTVYTSAMAASASAAAKVIAMHWFRQDLRVHDNPALCAALDGCDEFYPVFIFDGKVASE